MYFKSFCFLNRVSGSPILKYWFRTAPPPPPRPRREWIAPQKRAVLSSEWSHHIIIGLHLQTSHLEKRNISSNLTLAGIKRVKVPRKTKIDVKTPRRFIKGMVLQAANLTNEAKIPLLKTRIFKMFHWWNQKRSFSCLSLTNPGKYLIYFYAIFWNIRKKFW